MSGHLPARSRFPRASTSSAQRDSSMLKSPSTPLDVYRLQHRVERQSSAGNGTSMTENGSPRPSVFLEHESPQSFASYRRNVGFGSPGAHAIRSPARLQQSVSTSTTKAPSDDHRTGTPSRTSTTIRSSSKKFIRKRPWKQRIRDLPSLWYDQLVFSEYLDLANPAIGYPIGGALHFLSFLVLMMHPDGCLHYGGGSGRGNRTSSLFVEQSGLGSRRRSQQEAAWRFTANMILFAIIVGVLSSAYSLLTSRRRYHLWLKPVDEQLNSGNASLVALPNELGPTSQKLWYELVVEAGHRAVDSALRTALWLAKRMLYRIRLMRYIGAIVRFFFPASSARRQSGRRSSSSGPQMHALDVWQAPEVQLRILTVYSPLHLLFYLYNVRKTAATLSNATKISHLLLGIAVMVLISAQTFALVYLYTGLIKDKALIAGEVMNEYNQKFVMPRAMPICRDASTMTTQSEMISTDDLRGNDSDDDDLFVRRRPKSKKSGRSTSTK